MTTFSVNINMSAETVEDLKRDGYKLFGFKAVAVSVKDGVPLVWFVEDDFLANISVSWEKNYQAYISTQLDLTPGTVIIIAPPRARAITSSSTQNVDLGQIMKVDQYGNTSVVAGGQKDAITIVNESGKQLTCGISQKVATPIDPLYAVPIYGAGNPTVITPLEKVLFMFAAISVRNGTVTKELSSAGLMIDLPNSGGSRDVEYDMNKGWTPTDQIWAQPISAQSDLTE